MRRKRILVTVDWDYFVREDPMWDLGHLENLLFLKYIWISRGSLMDKMLTNGRQDGFWDRIALRGFPFVSVSDSHAYAWTVAAKMKANEIVSFDAHHDCWEEDERVECHNWLRAWLKCGRHRKATWVRPDHHCGEVPPDMESRLSVSDVEPVLDLKDVVAVHVCRSGCWVPPWLDAEFCRFVYNVGAGEIVKLQDGEWNPMVSRWDDATLMAAKETYGAGQRNRNIHDINSSMVAFTMPSSMFSQSRVEVSVAK